MKENLVLRITAPKGDQLFVDPNSPLTFYFVERSKKEQDYLRNNPEKNVSNAYVLLTYLLHLNLHIIQTEEAHRLLSQDEKVRNGIETIFGQKIDSLLSHFEETIQELIKEGYLEYVYQPMPGE